MKNMFITGMLIITLMFAGKAALHVYGIAQLIGSVPEANASVNSR